MKTVRVRIAVVVGEDGSWGASGAPGVADATVVGWADEGRYMIPGHDFGEESRTATHWVEADVPVPEPIPETIIEGVVSDGT